MYSAGPGKRPPFGYALDPPHGPGFEIPAYTLPCSSTLTGFHAPPPPLEAGCDHGSLIVWKRQTILPVSADSA